MPARSLSVKAPATSPRKKRDSSTTTPRGGITPARFCPNLKVAVLGSPGFSRELGKKGTESDVTLYNARRGDSNLTLIEASKYPEKLASLYYAVSFADYAVLVVDQINAAFGETGVLPG